MRAVNNKWLSIFEAFRYIEVATVPHLLTLIFESCNSIQLASIFLVRVKISDYLLYDTCLQYISNVNLFGQLSNKSRLSHALSSANKNQKRFSHLVKLSD